MTPQDAYLLLEGELFDVTVAAAPGDHRHDFALSAAFDRCLSSTLVNNAKLFDILGKLATLYIVEQRSTGTKALGVAQLHTLIWSGVLNMTYNSVAATLYCWDLVCSTVPAASEIVFQEILNVWRYVAYRGGIVVPGAIAAPRPAQRQTSELLHSKGFTDLNSHFESTQLAFMFPREATETGIAFQHLELKHLLEIQEGLLDFISKRYFSFLARSSQSLKYLVRLVFETVCLPVSTAAIREKRGMQVCLKLFILALNMLSAYSSAGDADLPNYALFRNNTLKFMLKAFSSSYTWRQVGRSTKLEAELSLLQAARGLCLSEEIDAQLSLGKYTVSQRPRPSTTDVEHSGCNLFFLRQGKSLGLRVWRRLLASSADAQAARLGVDVPAGSPKATKCMRVLLHLLLSDEYERLYTWNRPTLTDIIASATSV